MEVHFPSNPKQFCFFSVGLGQNIDLSISFMLVLTLELFTEALSVTVSPTLLCKQNQVFHAMIAAESLITCNTREMVWLG